MLSIIIDKNLINVFSLMYPIQFILAMLKSIFSVGANISKEKDEDKYAVGNGLLAAIITGFIIYGLLLINIENYITFMKMDVNIYKDFAIYSVIYFYIQLVFNFIVEKLYYEEKNKLANKYSIIFNVLNFLLLILTYLITNSRLITIIVTLLVTFIYTLYLLIKERSKINFKFKILKWLKYDAVNFFHALCFFIIFLFGIRNAFSFGPQYSIAISFVSLITDTQWDVFTAINTLAKVDIAKGKFNYKESRNNAYKLLFILMVSIFIMFLIFHRTYNLNLLITFTFLSSEKAKYILRIILIKHNRCGMAELLYLCELSYDECIDSINELFKSNFLQQNEDFTYSILDFAIAYIQNVKGFSNYSIDTKIQQAINKLNGSLENLKKDIHLTNEYHPLSLFPQNDNERIATLYMLAAIEASKARDYVKVDKYFTLAKNSANTYSDIYKIAGYLYSKFDSIKSEENYKLAIELAEDKAPFYYFFAGSLINNQKYEMAEIEISKALRINPDNNLIKLRCARLYKMQNKYDESLKILESINISADSDFSNKMHIKYIFETIDTRIRYAESLLKIDNKKVENLIKSTIKFIENSDIALFDFTIYTSMFKLAHLYIRLLYITDYKTDSLINYLFHFHPYILAAKNGHKKEQLFNTDLENLLLKISEADAKKINDIINYKATIKELNYGYVSRLKENGYGFITPISYTYQTIFFHCSQFKGDFRRLKINDKVSFELVVGDKIQAINVNLYTSDNTEEKIELDYISDME